jgi:hypothetical protein
MRLVVVGTGMEASFRLADGATELAARRLASTLSLPHRRLSDPQDPQGQLRQLGRATGGWLASLPLDPGQALVEGGTWAEALGAWRQPTLLVIRWQQLASGAAASTTALLRQWRVPLLGLLQTGGSWNADSRRGDGLPWLGRLEEGAPAEGDGAARALGELILRRWSHLDPPEPWPTPE